MTVSLLEPARPLTDATRQDRVDLRNYTLLIVVAAVFAVFQVLTDGLFLSQRNLGLLALQTTIVGLSSISAVMLIVTRNFDLSVGSAVALVGVVLASLTVKLGWNPWLAVVAAILAGIVLGPWNAVWVAKVGVSSFIVTLAGMMIFRGVSLIVTDGATVAPLPATLTDLAAGYLGPVPSIAVIVAAFGAFVLFTIASARRAQRFGLIETGIAPFPDRSCRLAGAVLAIYVSLGEGMPYLILVLAVMATLADVLMRRTRYGAQLYAVGGNPEAARLSGIVLRRVVFANFVIAGFFYGITGVALTGTRQRGDRRHCRPVPRARRHRRGGDRRHQPRRRAGPHPRCAARRDVDGSAQQRDEPDEHRHLLPTDGPRGRPAPGGRHRPAQPPRPGVDPLTVPPRSGPARPADRRTRPRDHERDGDATVSRTAGRFKPPTEVADPRHLRTLQRPVPGVDRGQRPDRPDGAARRRRAGGPFGGVADDSPRPAGPRGP